MALDPRISLMVQPPQFTVQPLMPYDLLGQRLTLQGLMTQNQVRDVGLEQARMQLEQQRLDVEERNRMIEWFRNRQQAAQVQPPPVTATPLATPAVVPSAAVPPTVSPIVPPTDAVTAPAPRTLADIMTIPPAPPPPEVPPAPAATPAPQTGPAPIVPTVRQGNEWSFAGGLDPIEFQRQFPRLGGGYVKSYYDSLESAFKAKHQDWQTQVDRNDRLSSYAQSIIPGRQETVTAAVMNARQNGDITDDQARNLINRPSDDPFWQSWIKQAAKTNDYLSNQINEAKLGIEQAQEQRAKALFGPQLSKAFDDALQSNLTSRDRQRIEDGRVLFAARSQSKEAYEQLRDSLPIGRRAYFMGADSPIDIYNRTLNPEQYVSQYNANLQNLMEFAKLKETRRINDIEYGQNTVPYWVEQIHENPDSVSLMPEKLRGAVGQGLQQKYNLPLPTALDAAGKQQETAARSSLDNVSYIRQAIENPEIAAQIGPIMGRLGNAEMRAGTAVGLSPQAEQLAQQLRTRMRYFIFQEGKGVMGGRLPIAMMKALEESSPSVKMDANMLKGALDGAEGAAQNSLNNLEKQRFGGRMRSPEARGAPGAVPGNVQRALKDVPRDGATHQLSDGSAWRVNTDGSITAVQPPR